jgi:hypothetical protein
VFKRCSLSRRIALSLLSLTVEALGHRFHAQTGQDRRVGDYYALTSIDTIVMVVFILTFILLLLYCLFYSRYDMICIVSFIIILIITPYDWPSPFLPKRLCLAAQPHHNLTSCNNVLRLDQPLVEPVPIDPSMPIIYQSMVCPPTPSTRGSALVGSSSHSPGSSRTRNDSSTSN